ncbi:hypothetical protein [Spirosoma rigui]|uniref:hypothetical protein n=1 Tax=Spirosoma rigui TaxID=564064 RepID=UPI0009B112C5|nr:hypothetical protein [Spirosoma rigui]
MNRYLFITLLGLILAAGRASAKHPTAWNRGELFLKNGTTLTGELNYNWKAEVVQLKQDDVIKAFSAFQVRSFRFFDDKLNTLRIFTSVQHPVRLSFRRPVFMEQVMTGSMTVYRRLRRGREPILATKPATFSTDAELVQNLDEFDYFVYEGDKMTNLNQFPRELWPMMHDEYGDELKRFGSTLLVDRNSTLARLLFINQYNSLKSQESPASAGTALPGMYGPE